MRKQKFLEGDLFKVTQLICEPDSFVYKFNVFVPFYPANETKFKGL